MSGVLRCAKLRCLVKGEIEARFSLKVLYSKSAIIKSGLKKVKIMFFFFFFLSSQNTHLPFKHFNCFLHTDNTII